MEYQPFNAALTKIKNFLNDSFIPPIQKMHQDTTDYINSYAMLYSNWKSKLLTLENNAEAFKVTAELHREIESRLDDQNKMLNNELLFTQYNLLDDFLNECLLSFDEELILNQEPSHFNPRENDSVRIQSQKKIKSVSYAISKKSLKLFKGKEREYNWKRYVPLRNLSTNHLSFNFLAKVLKESEIYIESIGTNLIKLLNSQKLTDTNFINSRITFLEKEVDSNFEDSYQKFIKDLDNITLELNSAYEKYISIIHTELTGEFEELQSNFNIIGTIELPKRKFNDKRKINEVEINEIKAEKSKINYKNFISAVIDRKEYYADLLWFGSLLIGNSYNIKKYLNPFIAKNINPTISEIKLEINNSIKNIENYKSDLASTIESEKNNLKEKFDQELIPSLINLVVTNKLPDVLKDYQKKIEQNLNEFEKDYTFVNPKNLVYRLNKDQLKKFSPKEIIYPIVINKLNNDALNILENFELQISKLNSTIMGLGQIVEFNLDSAKIKLKEDSSENEDSILIAKEGLLRAENKIEDYGEQILVLCNEIILNIEKAIVDILDDFISLSNIDRLITIKLQVSKEKAIGEVKERFKEYYNKAYSWFLWLKTKSLSIFSASKEKIIGISSRVGLGSGQVELSEAMADYLNRVSESLEQLPFVYQRLFSNVQLTDERIFIGREEECTKLEKALSYWKNNQISSVMLIGEKGSGTSTLINIVMKKIKIDSSVFREEFSGTIFEEKDLLDHLKKILKLDSVETKEELIETLNSLNERIIVIIENIEDFFLRIVDGFAALNMLMEIITSTNTKVLWITTCNIYSWNYLKKVININDFFIFNIKLCDLNNKIVEEIILSRHNISGYDLDFVAPKEITTQKSFIKLDKKGKQEYLKKEFFENLTKLTSNNIAVALFIWLRSIVSANEEKITVSLDMELDFSFLKSLSDQKLFSLMAILLHDGLSHEEHSKIFNISLKSSQLLFATLSDDGIIFRRGRNYKVNFQLYKPIISLLKDKNILH